MIGLAREALRAIGAFTVLAEREGATAREAAGLLTTAAAVIAGQIVGPEAGAEAMRSAAAELIADRDTSIVLAERRSARFHS